MVNKKRKNLNKDETESVIASKKKREGEALLPALFGGGSEEISKIYQFPFIDIMTKDFFLTHQKKIALAFFNHSAEFYANTTDSVINMGNQVKRILLAEKIIELSHFDNVYCQEMFSKRNRTLENSYYHQKNSYEMIKTGIESLNYAGNQSGYTVIVELIRKLTNIDLAKVGDEIKNILSHGKADRGGDESNNDIDRVLDKDYSALIVKQLCNDEKSPFNQEVADIFVKKMGELTAVSDKADIAVESYLKQLVEKYKKIIQSFDKVIIRLTSNNFDFYKIAVENHKTLITSLKGPFNIFDLLLEKDILSKPVKIPVQKKLKSFVAMDAVSSSTPSNKIAIDTSKNVTVNSDFDIEPFPDILNNDWLFDEIDEIDEIEQFSHIFQDDLQQKATEHPLEGILAEIDANCARKQTGNSASSSNTSIQSEAIRRMSCVRSGLKRMEKIDLVNLLKLPVHLVIGYAIDDGGCFFDALAQSLNFALKTKKYDEDSLRMMCHQYYLNNPGIMDALNAKDTAAYHGDKYLMVQYSKTKLSTISEFKERIPMWGRSHIEGMIICRTLELDKIHVIELLNVADEIVVGHCWVTKEGMKSFETPKDFDYENSCPTIIVSQNDLHFVPVLDKEAMKASLQPRLRDEEQEGEISEVSNRISEEDQDLTLAIALSLAEPLPASSSSTNEIKSVISSVSNQSVEKDNELNITHALSLTEPQKGLSARANKKSPVVSNILNQSSEEEQHIQQAIELSLKEQNSSNISLVNFEALRQAIDLKKETSSTKTALTLMPLTMPFQEGVALTLSRDNPLVLPKTSKMPIVVENKNSSNNRHNFWMRNDFTEESLNRFSPLVINITIRFDETYNILKNVKQELKNDPLAGWQSLALSLKGMAQAGSLESINALYPQLFDEMTELLTRHDRMQINCNYLSNESITFERQLGESDELKMHLTEKVDEIKGYLEEVIKKDPKSQILAFYILGYNCLKKWTALPKEEREDINDLENGLLHYSNALTIAKNYVTTDIPEKETIVTLTKKILTSLSDLMNGHYTLPDGIRHYMADEFFDMVYQHMTILMIEKGKNTSVQDEITDCFNQDIQSKYLARYQNSFQF